MKRVIKRTWMLILAISLFSCTGKKETDNSVKTDNKMVGEKETVAPLNAATEGKVQQISTAQFVKYVHDFNTSATFALKSEIPCVIDFYADWCKPCKMIAPYLDELAAEYKGKVHFLKVNVDEEAELANYYRIQAIPAMMFCPLKGEYVMEIGGADKTTIKKNVQKNVLK